MWLSFIDFISGTDWGFACQIEQAGQAVIINDHSNRLDMLEHVDGIYAEMGDMAAADFSGHGPSGAPVGGLNAHGIGTALASLGPTVTYIWNHPKSEKQMTEEFVSRGLMTHLYAGVFPTVPIKNNDHAIGGDCAPSCAYDAYYAAYGPLFDSIRSRSWVLAPHAVVVTSANALANLFSVPTAADTAAAAAAAGDKTEYRAVVALAPQSGTVTLAVAGLDKLSCATPRVEALSPANQPAASAKLSPSACPGGGKCVGVGKATITVTFGAGGKVSSSAAVVRIGCW